MAAQKYDPSTKAVSLKAYAEKLQQTIKSETNPNKREFFERDLKKTLAKIDKLK